MIARRAGPVQTRGRRPAPIARRDATSAAVHRPATIAPGGPGPRPSRCPPGGRPWTTCRPTTTRCSRARRRSRARAGGPLPGPPADVPQRHRVLEHGYRLPRWPLLGRRVPRGHGRGLEPGPLVHPRGDDPARSRAPRDDPPSPRSRDPRRHPADQGVAGRVVRVRPRGPRVRRLHRGPRRRRADAGRSRGVARRTQRDGVRPGGGHAETGARTRGGRGPDTPKPEPGHAEAGGRTRRNRSPDTRRPGAGHAETAARTRGGRWLAGRDAREDVGSGSAVGRPVQAPSGARCHSPTTDQMSPIEMKKPVKSAMSAMPP